MIKSAIENIFRKKPRVPCVIPEEGVLFEETKNPDGSISFSLADIEQTIGGVRQLTRDGITEMVEKKHDLDYQFVLCKRMMDDGDILPFPFERAAVLLRKEKRYEDELSICKYVEHWCKKQESEWNGSTAMYWKSPSFLKCIERIPKIELLIKTKNIPATK